MSATKFGGKPLTKKKELLGGSSSMIEKLLFAFGKKLGSVGVDSGAKISSSLSDDIKDLVNDGLVSNEYLRGLILRARSKEQLGRILHYLKYNNTRNLTDSQWNELRALVFARFKDMKIAELLSHLDLIIMHLF